jgi:hypothetical protein
VLGCLATALAGCLNVEAPDLFLLTRTNIATGQKLTLLISDGDTIQCDGGAVKPLPDAMLLNARDITQDLNTDAQHKLDIPRAHDSVDLYTVKVSDGTIDFPDTAARTHSELAQLELFTVQAAQGPCGLSG